MSVFASYLKNLKYYHNLQLLLTAVLDTSITLKPTNLSKYKFVPEYGSIVDQIKYWPDDLPFLPLHSWVDPQSGRIIWEKTEWHYFFHGSQGLTFRNLSSNQEVGVEYSTRGELGITKWTVKMFLKSANKSELQQLIHQNDKLFDEAVQMGYLVVTSTKILFVEEVFVLRG